MTKLFPVFSMEKKEEWGEAHVAFVDKARARREGGGGKKEEKSEEKEKESDSKVGRSARFRRARRAGHSSILASRADGLSLPLPLRPSSSSSFSSGELSALSLSLGASSSERREVSARFLWFLASIGTNNPRSTTLDNFELESPPFLTSTAHYRTGAQMLNP